VTTHAALDPWPLTRPRQTLSQIRRAVFQEPIPVRRHSGFAKFPAPAYQAAMYEFCFPTRSTIVPAGPDWYHEIKYDGFCLRLERNGDRVQLATRGGYDCTKRYPWIVEAALKTQPAPWNSFLA